MNANSQHIELASREVPYFEQWLGVWSILPSALDSLVSVVSSMDITAHLASYRASNRAVSNRVDSRGVAVISVEGALQKHASSMGNGANSTVLAKKAIRQANADDEIGSILLNISSPGGTSAGTKELFDEIQGSKKPVIAYVDDLAASAAYWVASGASKIISNESGLIGSIGTYAVVTDVSAMAAQQGVKVHVVKAGAFKGSGVAGTEVSPEQLTEIQRLVDSRNEFFIEGVVQGRKMPKASVEALADGRIHPAKEAVSLGLIDAIGTFDSAFNEALVAASNYSTSKKEKAKMSIQELRAACPGANSDFLLSALESGATVADTALLWTQQVADQLATANKTLEAQASEIATLRTENAALTARLEATPTLPISSHGVAPLPVTANSDDTESSDSYWGKVRSLMENGKTRSEAMSFVNRQYPALREAMVAQANS